MIPVAEALGVLARVPDDDAASEVTPERDVVVLRLAARRTERVRSTDAASPQAASARRAHGTFGSVTLR